MGRRRGFWAEVQHQAAVAERDRRRAHVAAVREQARQQREYERLTAFAERQRVQAVRQNEREAREAERQAKVAHVLAEEMHAEVMSSQVALLCEEIDQILEATLGVDDFVDLGALRHVVSHPDFVSEHADALPAPEPIVAPPEPVFAGPPEPTGIMSRLPHRRSAHERVVHEARRQFDMAHEKWRAHVAQIPGLQLAQRAAHSDAEQQRLAALAADREAYDAACQARNSEVDAKNAELDKLIADLDAGDPNAVMAYLEIVFGNTIYPQGFQWDNLEYEFDGATGELTIKLEIPHPDQMPTAKSYKYVKAQDEIRETALTQKERRDRYASVVNNMTLRTMHEVWESDRRGHITSISLIGGVAHKDPATGQDTFTPLVAVAADRVKFDEIDLAHVAPAETLSYLGATVAKSPHTLAPISLTAGVRKS